MGRIGRSPASARRCEAANPRALQPQTAHQPAFIEREDVDTASELRGVQPGRDALIRDDDARRAADFPAASLVQARELSVIHEKHRLAESLEARLQAARRRGGAEVTERPPRRRIDQRPFAPVDGHDEAGLGDPREDQHRARVALHIARPRIGADQPVQRGSRVAIDPRGARGTRAGGLHQGEAEDHGRDGENTDMLHS